MHPSSYDFTPFTIVAFDQVLDFLDRPRDVLAICPHEEHGSLWHLQPNLLPVWPLAQSFHKLVLQHLEMVHLIQTLRFKLIQKFVDLIFRDRLDLLHELRLVESDLEKLVELQALGSEVHLVDDQAQVLLCTDVWRRRAPRDSALAQLFGDVRQLLVEQPRRPEPWSILEAEARLWMVPDPLRVACSVVEHDVYYAHHTKVSPDVLHRFLQLPYPLVLRDLGPAEEALCYFGLVSDRVVRV